MEWLSHFVGYMFFSSLEYFSMFFIIFSLFNLHVQYYKKEIIIVVAAYTLISFIMTSTELFSIVPTPVIQIPILSIMLHMILKKKFYYSFITLTSGYVIYSLIQLCVVGVCLYYKFIGMDNLEDSFTKETYTIQTLSAFIGILSAIFVTYFREGFGFSFRRGHNKLFVYATLILFVTIVFVSFLFIIKSTTLPMYFVVTILFFTAFLVLLYFSKKQDDHEYQ